MSEMILMIIKYVKRFWLDWNMWDDSSDSQICEMVLYRISMQDDCNDYQICEMVLLRSKHVKWFWWDPIIWDDSDNIKTNDVQKGHYAICGQCRSWSACTFVQADLGLHCPLAESVDTVVQCWWTETVQIKLHGCVRLSGSFPQAPVAYWIGELTLNPFGFSLLWFEPRSGQMWKSQVLLTDGQVVFPWVLRFSPTFDEW